ncbi:hypothetical protein Vadar_028557 [Vaccinium darrowii]|uniref:Uncharacterized protein n=1 Tax=Vaccinium darrowii TaxID=229202 RepID=A0ACB7XLR0_9ERIC|nr:hypothetical protein Vadar_028557 [Vaccinium darrowii]
MLGTLPVSTSRGEGEQPPSTTIPTTATATTIPGDHDPRRCHRRPHRLHLRRALNRVEFNDVNGNDMGLDLDSMVSAQVGDVDTIDVDLKSGNSGDSTGGIAGGGGGIVVA